MCAPLTAVVFLTYVSQMTGGRTAPTQARHIIDTLGGRTEAARILGWPLTKVDSCLRSGFVRCQDQKHVMASAWSEGIKIDAHDFVVHLRGLTPPWLTNERTAAAG
jgi:hypothetical protein